MAKVATIKTDYSVAPAAINMRYTPTTPFIAAPVAQINQTTVAQPSHHSGHGLHTGRPVALSIYPGKTDQGIVFVRTDLPREQNRIPARYDYVTDTRLCTVLTNEHGATVRTCEHLLATFSACDIDNAEVHINGPELPIGDGSAQGFVELLRHAGSQQSAGSRWVIELNRPIHTNLGQAHASLYPAAHVSYDIKIDFSAKDGPIQSLTYTPHLHSFAEALAPARTFCFLNDVNAMRENNLALGGSLENAIVLDQGQVLNPEGLRFEDECVRHKTMDVIGDMTLAGATVLATFIGEQVGHRLTNMLLRDLFAQKDAWTRRPMTREDLKAPAS